MVAVYCSIHKKQAAVAKLSGTDAGECGHAGVGSLFIAFRQKGGQFRVSFAPPRQ
jgi:hypothetical protein